MAEHKGLITDFLIKSEPQKRGRGRPKGSKNRVKGQGIYAKKRKQEVEASALPTADNNDSNTKQKRFDQKANLVDLTEEDARAREAQTIDLTKEKETRINWNDQKHKKYVDRVCQSWLSKSDLCAGKNESMRKFAER